MTLPSPQGWGDDSLTAYLDVYRGNQFATFANKQVAAKHLIEIDNLFTRLLEGAINPRPFAPMNFYLRAHSGFRAACGAVMAGQVYESQALLRLCLEHAAYGFYIGDNQDRWERWMNRHENEMSKQKVRDEFSQSKIKAHLKTVSTKLLDRYVLLYEELIDFGAHPNERGFSLNSAIRNENGNIHFDTVQLQENEFLLDYALRRSAQIGLWVLHAAQITYPERSELLVIRAKLEEVRQHF